MKGGCTMENDSNLMKYFLMFANNNPCVWKELVGQKVMHSDSTLKSGIIKEIIVEDTGGIDVRILFEEIDTNSALKRFDRDVFKLGYVSILDFDLLDINGFSEFYTHKIDEEKREAEINKMKRKQRLQEERVLQEFNLLKKKYGLQNYKFNTSSPLFNILNDLEASKKLDGSSTLWLSENIPALYLELEYSKTNDLWQLIKACTNWRKADNPNRVIQLLQSKQTSDKKIMSAILNLLGAAYRDIDELEIAEKCARDAVTNNNKSFYPHNLLGAIYYQKGMPEQGDTHFDIAIQLGSNPYKEPTIKESLKKAGYEERNEIARYLLQKDPQKYKWAQDYLV
jgi:tetratricopeptide (TPR) repeat protein